MLRRFYHVGVNVRDLDRSLKFYEMLGFVNVHQSELDNPSLAPQFGLPRFGKLRYAMLRLGTEPDGVMLDMTQFVDPPPVEDRLETLHRVGFARICFHVDDISDTYEKLKAAGVEMFHPLTFTPTASGDTVGLLFFRDPDGNILELMDWKSAP